MRETSESDITCVIPTHERPEFLDRALDSVYRQSLAPAQVIVSDNVGDAKTASVIAKWSSFFGSRLTHAIAPPGQGALENWRHGLRQVRTHYTKVVWDDDWLEPGCLEHLVLALDKHRAHFAVCGAFGHVNGSQYSWYQHAEFHSTSIARVLPLVARNQLPVSPLAGLQVTEDALDALEMPWFKQDGLKPNLVVGPDLAITYMGLIRRRRMVFTPTPLVNMFSDGANMTFVAGDEIEEFYIYTLQKMSARHLVATALVQGALRQRRRRLGNAR